MGDHYGEHRCIECDRTGGGHYPGCTYEGTGKESYHSSGSRKGMSTFGATMCSLGGFIGAASILALLNVDVESASPFSLGIIFILLLSIICAVLGNIFGK